MYYFTSESVSPGHPDKLCDHLSDTVLDHVLRQDKSCRVACETFVKGKSNEAGTVVIGGEITTSSDLNIDDTIRWDNNVIIYKKTQATFQKKLTK